MAEKERETNIVKDLVPEIGISAARNQPKKRIKSQVEPDFLQFLAIFFGIFDDFSIVLLHLPL